MEAASLAKFVKADNDWPETVFHGYCFKNDGDGDDDDDDDDDGIDVAPAA